MVAEAIDWGFQAVRAIQILLIVVAGYFAGKIVHHLLVAFFRHVISRTAHELDDYILKYAENSLKAIAIVGFVFAFSAWVDDLRAVQSAMTQYAGAILVLLASFLVSELIGAILRWYYDKGQTRSRLKFDVTLLPFARKASRVIIIFVGILGAIGLVGIDISSILTLTSVLMLILGLASQETLANIFAGMALQLDRPYNYKDYLRFPTGEVVKLRKIGTRSTRLEDIDGNLMVVSNSEFAKLRITNLSRPKRDFRMSVLVDVPLKTDLTDFELFLRSEIGNIGTSGIKHPPISVAIEKTGASTISVSVNYWSTDYFQAHQLRDLVNRKVAEFIKRPDESPAE